MDPSTQAAQDVQNQQPANQSVDQGQQSTTTQPASVASIAQNGLPAKNPTAHKTQISISGGGVEAEAGGAMVMQEDPDADNEEEEALKVAPQEKKTQVVMSVAGDEQDEDQQSASQAPVVDVQEAEVQPAVPEVAISPEVEKIVELTPPETPKITDELKDLGVTHSGPGIIDVSQVQFKPKPIPVSYEQALTEEEKIKENRLHNSRFWLLEHIKYLWRKLNPTIDQTVKKQAVKKVVPISTNPVPTSQVTSPNKTNQG
jgi:hypothetical protein